MQKYIFNFFIFSSGGLQLQCQCESGMAWNGAIVSIEIFQIKIVNFIYSILV
jgi:hypothetical protein